jgi:hypothetical protein
VEVGVVVALLRALDELAAAREDLRDARDRERPEQRELEGADRVEREVVARAEVGDLDVVLHGVEGEDPLEDGGARHGLVLPGAGPLAHVPREDPRVRSPELDLRDGAELDLPWLPVPAAERVERREDDLLVLEMFDASDVKLVRVVGAVLALDDHALLGLGEAREERPPSLELEVDAELGRRTGLLREELAEEALAAAAADRIDLVDPDGGEALAVEVVELPESDERRPDLDREADQVRLAGERAQEPGEGLLARERTEAALEGAHAFT